MPKRTLARVDGDAFRPRLSRGTSDCASKSDIEDDQASHAEHLHLRRPRRQHLLHVTAGDADFPPSAYLGRQLPSTISSEADALASLRSTLKKEIIRDAGGYSSYEYCILDSFSIYRDTDAGSRAGSLISLDQLQNGRGCDEFLFDGVLHKGAFTRLLQGVRFRVLAIDGYGDLDIIDTRAHICIQSKTARDADIWYRLGKPSTRYQRFYEPFIWLSTFTKHFVDFLLSHDQLTLIDFKQRFFGWLYVRLSKQRSFQKWLSLCQLRDFRTTVAAHVGFLWKECHAIDDDESGLLKHPLWKEADPVKLSAIPRQPLVECQTIVTPFVYACFRHMYFAEHLQERHVVDPRVRKLTIQRKEDMRLTVARETIPRELGLLTPESDEYSRPDTLEVLAGDVVCVFPDTAGEWKSSATCWYAYVQTVRIEACRTMLDVIWLYDRSDTTIGNSYYPFPNELFLSDNCSCGKNAINIDEVICKAQVSFFVQHPASAAGLFVRQKFRTVHEDDKYDFVSLQVSDFVCACGERSTLFEDCRNQFQIGETILFLGHRPATGQQRFEPAQVVDFLLERRQVVLRRLRRKAEYDELAPPNELLLTSEIFSVAPSLIYKHCHVRYFDPEVVREGLPVPYSQGGVGAYFYITRDSSTSKDSVSKLSWDSDSAYDDAKLPPLDESWDPDARPPLPKLKGMGLFCGGGNFDRGIEDGGAIDFEYAIDYNEHALHSYRANARDPEHTQLFLGSVDDYLAQAIAGSTEAVIASVGQCQVIAAGSPCQGFSIANRNAAGAGDFQGQRNASKIASVLSYVDFYSPQYCVLENVLAITNHRGPRRDESVFRQILATLVAMGYQVQQFLMEAWLFGSAQRRSRVFIVASAPGVEPLPAPSCSHGDTARWPERKLGLSSNGKPFGCRKQEESIFAHISPQIATADLPDIGDSLPQICPSHPDHRVACPDSNLGRACAASVPRYPKGMGLVQAIRRGYEQQALLEKGEERSLLDGNAAMLSVITGGPLELYQTTICRNPIRSREKSKLYARIHPDLLFPTMLTVMQPSDALNGPALHWSQPRCITIMEARRAQGFLDHEVLIGNPAQQMRIIGNSVDRKVAITLGLALRESWLQTALKSARTSQLSMPGNESDEANEVHVRGLGWG